MSQGALSGVAQLPRFENTVAHELHHIGNASLGGRFEKTFQGLEPPVRQALECSAPAAAVPGSPGGSGGEHVVQGVDARAGGPLDARELEAPRKLSAGRKRHALVRMQPG